MRLAPLVIEIMINAAAAVESVGAAAEGEILMWMWETRENATPM